MKPNLSIADHPEKYFSGWGFLLKLFFLPLLLLAVNTAYGQKLDMKLMGDMKPRSIGPAGMSGRITSFDVVLKNPKVIYAGTASGGLWKSENGGMSWKPLFQQEKVASIGSISIDQSNPNIIWLGTGEGNPRNSQSSGNGVYRSIDGGRTWIHMGLENTRNIHRIYVNAQNPDIIYVGAQGTAWADSPDRGVYRSTDGGENWEKVLYVNERTGIADLVVDPENPNKLIAGMWEFRRWPWFFKSGGEGSGIYISYDAGKSWEKRTAEDGLPEGELGRIGLAIAPSNPEIIYAYVESRSNGIYRSEDGGFSWTKTTKDKDPNMGNRPFYYADIYVDTQNENRLYSLATYVTVSEDGGKTFERFIDRAIHVDYHAFWSHPEDPDFLLLGNDGGMAISHDRGKSWYFPETLALGQFYHINVDMETPYNIYGGLQDNGSWSGPSQVWSETGIRNAYWKSVGGGDGFDVVPDPQDAKYGYAMSQGGNLLRYNLTTGGTQRLKPVHPEGEHLRFNWNAGIAIDPFDQETLYYGAQYLLKSTDNGGSWEVISPDLTTNDPEKQKQIETGGLTIDNSTAENHTTIITVAPSPKQEGVIWVGTDDGNVQLTQNGGESWVKLNENIKGVPSNSWVTQIQASIYDPAEAFVVFDNHRMNDWTPYVYRTRDFGKSWERIVDENKVWGYALSLVQDPLEPNLLFCGTEFGLYISIDGGKEWTQWTNAYPTVSTMDMVIHPRDHDLVLGTFGRSVFILDDIRPLRALAREGSENILSKTLHAFEAPEAYLVTQAGSNGYNSVGNGLFEGENRPYGALISYYIQAKEKQEEEVEEVKEVEEEAEEKAPFADSVKIEILDKHKQVVRSLYKTPRTGINRIAWELDRKEVRSPNEPKPDQPEPEKGGFAVLPGEYMARISYAGQVDSTLIVVKPDPRLEISEDILLAKEEMVQRYLKNVSTVTAAVDNLNDADETLDMLMEQLKKKEDAEAKVLAQQSKELKKSIQQLIETINPKEIQGFTRDPELLSSKLSAVSTYLNSPLEAPVGSLTLAMEQAEEGMKVPLEKIEMFFEKDWNSFKLALENANISMLQIYSLNQ